MIIIYDEEAYKICGRSHVCNLEDVKRLNSLQVLNCDYSVYYSDILDNQYISSDYVGSENRNLGVSEFEYYKHTTDPLRELVMQKEKRVIPSTPLSFMKPRIYGKVNQQKTISPTRFQPDEIERFADSIEEQLLQKNAMTWAFLDTPER